MKRLILAILSLVMIIAGCVLIANGQENRVEITTKDNSLLIVEKITLDDDVFDGVFIWTYPINRTVTINDKEVTLPEMYNLPYSINLTEQNITITDYYELEYYLNKDVEGFSTTLQYNTTLISITLDGTEIYTGNNLAAGSSITVALQKQSEGETVNVETIPIWIYAVIGILILIIILSFVRPTKIKRSSTEKKSSATGTKEFFTTNKSLLMETLKEIEKLHRGKKISDESYNKLKDRYKQDAVDTMRKLEDIKK